MFICFGIGDLVAADVIVVAETIIGTEDFMDLIHGIGSMVGGKK